MMTLLINLLTGRFGLAALALGAALSWHYIDKATAVRSAKDALADQIEISALKSELEASKALAEKAQVARDKLALEIKRTAEISVQQQQELKEYGNTTTINPRGVVDNAVLGRLRNR